jgi:hypothetical protein
MCLPLASDFIHQFPLFFFPLGFHPEIHGPPGISISWIISLYGIQICPHLEFPPRVFYLLFQLNFLFVYFTSYSLQFSLKRDYGFLNCLNCSLIFSLNYLCVFPKIRGVALSRLGKHHLLEQNLLLNPHIHAKTPLKSSCV